jgi:hypothetical protein
LAATIVFVGGETTVAATAGGEITDVAAGAGVEFAADFVQRGTKMKRMKIFATPMIATTITATAIQRRFMAPLRLSAAALSIKKIAPNESRRRGPGAG